MGISEEQMKYSQSEQAHLFDDLETGKIYPAQFREEIRNMSFLGLTDNEIDDAWNALLLDLPKDRIELLKSLSNKYRIFLLSNTNVIHYNAYSQYLKDEHGIDGLEPLFEKTYLSHEVGLRKPDAEIFELVLNENKLEASETLFIDDSEQHIKGAEVVGLKTHWLNEGDVIGLFQGLS